MYCNKNIRMDKLIDIILILNHYSFISKFYSLILIKYLLIIIVILYKNVTFFTTSFRIRPQIVRSFFEDRFQKNIRRAVSDVSTITALVER